MIFGPNQQSLSIVLTALPLIFLSSCVSRNDQEGLRANLFRAQTRLLELEHKVDKSCSQNKSVGTQTSRNIAAAAQRQDQMQNELRLMKGEIGTLRQGVITGEMPGFEEKTDSVAKTLRSLFERVEGLEKTQIEILALLQKRKNKGKDRARTLLKNLSDIEKAYAKKKYLYITQDAPSVLKKKGLKEKVLEEIRLYNAKSLFKIGRLRDAVLAFNDLTEAKYLTESLPFIYLKVADGFRLLGDKKAAMIYYDELLSKFPESQEAVGARDTIAGLEPQDSKG